MEITVHVLMIEGIRMSLKIRFRFDARCILHPRYDPGRDGRPQHRNCEGCESLHVIHLYIRIAKRRATEGKEIVFRTLTHPAEQRGAAEHGSPSHIDPSRLQ